MGFGKAVSTCFSKYATFSGRARRSEYWWWVAFATIVYIVSIAADNVAKTTIKSNGTDLHYGWITGVVALVLLLPSLAVLFRRLHDSGHSGWWWLLTFICGIGALIVFIFTLFDSKPDNKWGPNPKTSIV